MDTYKLVDELSSNRLSSFIMQQNGEVVFHYVIQANASEGLMPINSCTKSIVSALYCIGLGEGWLPSIDRSIAEWFPALNDSDDKRKLNITVEHVLTLTAGFQWNEFGGSKDFPRMTRSSNWIDYVLKQPLSADPGTKWSYNSGISQLLSALIVRASGRGLDELVEEKLFGPLGISQYSWKTDPQGIHTGGYGMELTALDMLKFGQLFLQQGRWKEEQIIQPELCIQATTPYIQVEAPESGRYGWHWWCDEGHGVSYFYARGYGGQFIIVVPSANTVIVCTRNQKHKARSGLDIFRDMILPNLKAN